MVYIYILKLYEDKYYVGKTNYPNFRITEHFDSNINEWTKIYKPIEVIKLIPNCDDYDEDKYTKIYMDKFGVANVRGGSFVSKDLDASMIKLLTPKKEVVKGNDISLRSLLTHSPSTILRILSEIELLNDLKRYRIKAGDIILNIHKDSYETLREIIDDAELIFDNFDEYDAINIETIKKDMKRYRDNFYKNMALFLAKFPCEIFKELSEGITIDVIEGKLRKQLS